MSTPANSGLFVALFSQLFVLDFPPRLTVPEDLQTFLRQDFHRVAAQMGIVPIYFVFLI